MAFTRYKCRDCGNEFDDEELRRVKEPRGEFHGRLVCEIFCYCPHCGSDDYDDVNKIEEEEND